MSIEDRVKKIVSDQLGKSVDEISKALDRDNFMTATEALKYWLIDKIIKNMIDSKYLLSNIKHSRKKIGGKNFGTFCLLLIAWTFTITMLS